MRAVQVAFRFVGRMDPPAMTLCATRHVCRIRTGVECGLLAVFRLGHLTHHFHLVGLADGMNGEVLQDLGWRIGYSQSASPRQLAFAVGVTGFEPTTYSAPIILKEHDCRVALPSCATPRG